jgi:NAD(P)-dependent dehydrogenase (short-subunit alcohol dehydrogenase family)
VRLNFFGTVACLEGLRPVLAAGDRPRAVVVSSLSAIVAADEAIVAACLSRDEDAAVTAAAATVAAGKGRIIYGSSKRALNHWIRQAAPTEEWAGAGIPLNAVVPGVVGTPAARVSVLDDPVMRTTVQAAMPQPLGFPGPVEAVASLLEWTVSPDNSFMTGQLLFIDGGAEAVLRGGQRGSTGSW